MHVQPQLADRLSLGSCGVSSILIVVKAATRTWKDVPTAVLFEAQSIKVTVIEYVSAFYPQAVGAAKPVEVADTTATKLIEDRPRERRPRARLMTLTRPRAAD
jgi:hypothetical protein